MKKDEMGGTCRKRGDIMK